MTVERKMAAEAVPLDGRGMSGGEPTGQVPRAADIAGATGGRAGGAFAEMLRGFDAEDAGMDLRRALLTLWRARLLIIVATIVGLGLAYLQLARTTPLYTAETEVLWEVNQASFVDIDPVARGLSSDFFQLASQLEILRSSRLLGRVVDELGLTGDPLFNPALREPPGWERWMSARTLLREAVDWTRTQILGWSREVKPPPGPSELRRLAIDRLRDALDAKWMDGTYVLTIRVTLADARRAADLANAVAAAYIRDQLEAKFEATRAATEWLGERVAELRAELEAAEQAVKDHAASIGATSEKELAALTRQVKELRDRAASLAAEQVELRRRLARIEELREAGRLGELAALLREPRLEALAAAVGEARASAGTLAAFDAELARARERLEASLDRLARQQASVESTVAELEARLEEQSRALVELRQLEREAQASRLIYEAFLTRLKETSVQEGIQRPDARVLSEAEIPVSPTSPNRPVTLLFGAGGGFFLAVLMILVRERLDTSFRTPEALETASGLPVIGTIPLLGVRGRRGVLRHLVEHPASAFAEALRNLRTSILLANVDQPPKVILVSSALPGESKTTTCLGLARVSRALGKKVLAIECDLRRRAFRHYFDLPRNKPGLLALLSGTATLDEAIFTDETTGLDVLAAERSSSNAADLFASRRFAELLEAARERYDFVLVDTPPVLAVPDARVIAPRADAVVFVVRWNHTPRESVRESLRLFAQVRIRLAGLVLTQIDAARTAYYGYRSYQYKYAKKYYRS